MKAKTAAAFVALAIVGLTGAAAGPAAALHAPVSGASDGVYLEARIGERRVVSCAFI